MRIDEALNLLEACDNSLVSGGAPAGLFRLRELGEFLGESDLVKFARHRPSTEDGERAYTAARRFVEDTRERAEATEHAAG